MEKIILNSAAREARGKNVCKHLRKEGQIPGVIYKGGKEALSIQVDTKELWHALHTDAGENAIITINVTGTEKPLEKTVIVKEIQVDPINDKFVHVDFHEISLKETLKVKVPVVTKGEAAGVKEEDGVLSQLMWELEVECLPTNIPEHIDVQVDELNIGDAIHVQDIVAPEGVKILDDPEHVVASVNPPQAEEVVEEEAVEGEEGEEPELIKKGKKEEEGEAEAAAPAPEEEQG